jgi:hypothetical protein
MLDAETIRNLLHYDTDTGLFTWKVSRGGTATVGSGAGFINTGKSSGYVLIKVCCASYKAHRLAWLYMTGEWPAEQIDHINRCRSDNRWANLRTASHSQNQTNSNLYKNNTTGLKGVYWYKKLRKWAAMIRSDGHLKYLGVYDCPAAAHFSYLVAANKLRGDFTLGV